MRTPRTVWTLLLLAALPVGCGDGSTPTDGGMDAGHRMDGSIPSADAGRADGRVELDSGPECTAGQHLCAGICTDPMPDSPATGCRLGCGAPCAGGADAICNPDGTCGLRGCTPMSCEELAVMCGSTDDGCGRRIACGTCDTEGGQRCESGSCICDPDPIEPNDTMGTAHTLITLTDVPDSSTSVSIATLHRDGDVDWYRAAVTNNCCDGDPIVTVRLTGLPAGEDYDLGAWYQCPAGNAPSCTTGTADRSVASGGCVSNAVGDDTVAFRTNCDPDGTLFVRVSAPAWQGSCATYRVEIAVR